MGTYDKIGMVIGIKYTYRRIKMKTLLLVAKRKYAQDMYYRELKKVFGDRLNIIPTYHVSEDNTFLPASGIEQADIILITNVYSFPVVRRQMREGASIINLKFTFARDRIEALKMFPEGTDAVAVFNYYSSAQQTVDTLYESGTSNLNLYIDYPGNMNTEGKNISLAIISGKTDHIPVAINEIFDLGSRKISMRTLLDIAVRANLFDGETERSIAEYCKEIATPEAYLSKFSGLSSEYTMQIKTIMEYVDYGIAIYNRKGEIITYNKSFTDLLGLPESIYGVNIATLLKGSELMPFIEAEVKTVNKLCELQSRGIRVTVTNRRIDSEMPGQDNYIILVKDITELSNLEMSVRHQIAKSGHIAKYHFDDIKGTSAVMKNRIGKSRRIAVIDKPTLIIGESGTGKELVAQSIHNASSRAHYPFVAMNCAAIPAELLESELFGYAEGAFTGARKGGKEGLFQVAQKGTLFLDEIGELSLSTQAKLLRALEEREIMPVGSNRIISIDVRIIAATNRDLEILMVEGKFRMDLYYRLNTLIVNLPPLRERKDDVQVLIGEFLRQENKENVKFDPMILHFFENYEWRGNVRELRNCIEYMANIAGNKASAEHLPDYIRDKYELYYASGRKECTDKGRAAINSEKCTGKTLDEYETVPFLALADNDERDMIAVLNVLKRESMGRRRLMQFLTLEDYDITEYRIREAILRLAEFGMINVSKGRGGCSIKAAGIEYLKRSGGIIFPQSRI